MNELEGLRNDIDKIDLELVSLFEKRMEKVLEVAKYKEKNRIPILNEAREKQVVEKNISRLKNKSLEKATTDFLSRVMEISREIQGKIHQDEEILDYQRVNRKKSSLDYKLKIGYQGEPGSFSEEALIQYFGNNIDTYNVREFEDVFEALKKEDIDYGILPIENSSTGGISEVYDLLGKYGFYIVGERCIKVEHNLAAIKGTKIEEIVEVYSHLQAFEQSKDFLKGYPNLTLIPYKNTAISAKHIMEEKSKSKAAVCSKKAAELYGLEIIKENINYNKNNYTRFIVIGKDFEVDPNCNKISIVATIAHTPGSLYKTLSYFAENNLNLMKIESRPIINKSWEYFFYIDFNGNLYDERVKKSIEALKNNSRYFKLLGNYVGHKI